MTRLCQAETSSIRELPVDLEMLTKPMDEVEPVFEATPCLVSSRLVSRSQKEHRSHFVKIPRNRHAQRGPVKVLLENPNLA